jgi:hypothetical protein
MLTLQKNQEYSLVHSISFRKVPLSKIINILRYWLPLAAMVTLLSGLIYLEVQQSLRWGANDPQIQMGEDAATALAAGGALESVLPATQVEISSSLAPFMVIYNAKGVPLASSARLHGATPTLPPGIFDYTLQKGEDRVTWQPEPGVRIAAVVVAYGGAQPGFVLAGRSLREVEIRASQAEQITGIVWLVTIFVSLIVVAGCEFIFADRKHIN